MGRLLLILSTLLITMPASARILHLTWVPGGDSINPPGIYAEKGLPDVPFNQDNITYVDNTNWALLQNGKTITASFTQNADESLHIATIIVSSNVTITQDDPVPVLIVSPESRIVSAKAGSTSFSVNSNIDWAASENAGWLTAEKTNTSTLTVNYNENKGSNERSATITVSGPGVTSQKVTVIQQVATPSLAVTPASRTVGPEAGSTTFTVTSNINWTVNESANWLSTTKTNAAKLTVNYDENTSVVERTAYITISGPNVTSVIVEVNQNGAIPTLSVTPQSKTVAATSGSTSFSVVSNINWSISENADWFTATKTNNSTLHVNYDENTSVDERSASIALNGPGVTSQTVTLYQEGASPTLHVTPASVKVNSEAGSTTFSVNSNIVWEASEQAGWLTTVKTNATTLTVEYDANGSIDERSAGITVAGPNVTSQIVTISQDGSAPTLSVTPTSATVGAEAGSFSFVVNSNTQWTVRENENWLTATKEDANSLVVEYEMNPNTDERSGIITISVKENISQDLVLTQEGNKPIGLEDPSSDLMVKIYPNPASDIFIIEAPQDFLEEVEIKVVNTVGKVIINQKYDVLLKDQRTYIDFTDIPGGVYYIGLSTPNTAIMEKVIKR